RSDRSLSSPPTLLFSPYAEVPAHQFFNNPAGFLSTQNILASNLDNTPHPLDYYYQLRNLTTNESYVDASLGNGGGGAMLPLEQRLLEGPVFPSIPVNALDSQVFEATYYYNTGDKFLFEEVDNGDTLFLPVDLKVNDTIRHTYTMHNYYAYDDGIAEYSSGINVENGMLVVMYALEEQDTLTHIDIHFPDINPNNPAGKVINIIALRRLDEGVVRSQPFTIQLSNKLNGFTRIKLSTPLIVSDTFYIGYENTSNSLIGVGFDRNNIAASDFIYYNVLDSWIQNDELQGALMMRPVFQDGSEFILSAPIPELKADIYPNPTSGLINLPKYNHLSIYDLSGRFIEQFGYSPQLDLSNYPNGIYLLKFTIQGESIMKKVIVSH
ncbi:MAG: T9SS type A sorting domain-containing protein, partial [Cyclobacteriaceae bacterium]